MTAEATLAPGGVVWAKVTRICGLDVDGNVIPGASVFVTDQLMKATITPVNEAGDAIAIKNASGNLGVYALKGDIPKWYTVALEMVYPDPQLEALICNGTLFSDDSPALGAPADPPTVTAQTTLGNLATGTYDYAYAGYSVFGRAPISPDQTVSTTGATGANVISGFVFASGAVGVVVYGRYVGILQALGTVAAIGTQTSDDIPASAITSVGFATDPLTEPIPAGTTFQITSDTNTPPVTFTATETGGVGATSVAVQSVTPTLPITGGILIPVFFDDGSAKPSGVPNATDLSGGPGIGVGQQSPVPGFANATSISLEFFMERVEEGHQATDYPYYWFALPRCTYFVVGARDVTNAELQALYTGTAFPNPNWGAGPSGDFPFDTSGLFQWTVCGEDVVPEASYVAQAAGT